MRFITDTSIERYLNRCTHSAIRSRSYKILLFDSRNIAFIEPALYKQDSRIHPILHAYDTQIYCLYSETYSSYFDIIEQEGNILPSQICV